MVTRQKTDQPVERQTSKKSWTYRINDKEVTEEDYLDSVKEHREWVREQELAAAAEEEPVKRKKRGK